MYTYSPDKTPESLLPVLEELAQYYPIGHEGAADGRLMHFVPSRPAGYAIDEKAGEIVVHYADITAACRALGTLLSAEEVAGGEAQCGFSEMGIMLDCSRNAVIRPDHFKCWIRRLALLGYNVAMLYTEDTYQLPDAPYFGYQRGAYSLDELREMDAYAKLFGIELRACIQTLGHLKQVLRYPQYADIRCNPNVMLVGEEKTYDLIRKMLRFWSSALTSRTIHVGLDEAFGLTGGKYEQLNGTRSRVDVFLEHLQRVAAICEEEGVSAQMWSDMMYRKPDGSIMYSTQNHTRIPANVTPVYWDYYQAKEQGYLDRIQMHRDNDSEPVMASGVWTWEQLFYNHETTRKNAVPCMRACISAKVRNILFTMWGDDGAFNDFDAAFAGLTMCADVAWGEEEDGRIHRQRFNALCGGDYDAVCTASRMDSAFAAEFRASFLVWDDPLMQVFLRHLLHLGDGIYERIAQTYGAIATDLETHQSTTCGHLPHARAMARFLSRKVELLPAILDAYGRSDRDELRRLADQVPDLMERIVVLEKTMRAMWMHHQKPQGFESIQIRLSAQRTRIHELQVRLQEFLDGTVPAIPEFDENLRLVPAGPCPRGGFLGLAYGTAEV